MRKGVLLTMLLGFLLFPHWALADEPRDAPEDTKPSKVERLFKQASDLHNAGELDKAVEAYTKVIELDPKHADSYWNRANIYAKQEKYDLAIADYRTVNLLVPDLADAYGSLGWYLLVQGKFEDAKAPCQKAHDLISDSYAWTVNLGHAYLLTGDADKARAYYLKAIDLLKTDEDLTVGPLSDFQLFISKGWKAEESRKWMERMKHVYEKKKQIKEAKKSGDIKLLITALKDEDCFIRETAAFALVEMGAVRLELTLSDAFDEYLIGNAVKFREEHMALFAGAEGIIILTVMPGSQGEKAGLKRGDIIIQYDKETISSRERFVALVNAKSREDEVAIVYLRAGERAESKLHSGPVGIGITNINSIRNTYRILTGVLIGALKDSDSSVRIGAVSALKKMGDKSAVPALIEALKDSEESVRSSAASALEKIGDKSAAPALIEALKDSDGSVRRSAVSALEEIGDKSTVPALIAALKDSERGVSSGAASALGKIGDKNAVPAFLEELKDSDRWGRMEAATALGKIGNESAVPALIEALKDSDRSVRSSAASALGKIGDKSAVPALIEALKDSDRSVRSSAAAALGDIGGKSAVPALIEALGNSDEGVRLEAASALGKIGGKSSVLALLGALKDSEGSVRISAASALGEIRDNKSVSALLDALKDSDNHVRESVAGALGKLGDKNAVPALIEALKDLDEDVRFEAVDVLGNIGDKRAVSALIEALKDSYKYVRGMAAIVLGNMGDNSSVPFLIVMLKDSDRDVRLDAAYALGKIGDKRAVPALTEALMDSYGDVRLKAASILETHDDKNAVPVLVEVLKYSDRYGRRRIVEALGEIGDKSAVLALIGALGNSDEDVRMEAASALKKIGDKSAVPALIEALKERDIWGGRMEAVAGLGEMGDKRAVPALIEALGDRDGKVRIKAASALGEIHIAGPICEAFAESQSAYFFNVLNNKLLFDDKCIKLLTASDIPLLKSSGYYLLALQSREVGKYETQLDYADKGLEPIDPKKDTAIAILSLWLKTQAELELHKPRVALETIRKAEELRDYLSRKERDEYRELFEEFTLYLKGEVYTALNDGKQAQKLYDEALELLDPTKRDFYKKEQVERLERLVRDGRGNLLKKLQTENDGIALELSRKYEALNSVEMKSDERIYLRRVQDAIAVAQDGDYSEAQKLMEELNLKRSNYAQRRLKLNFADGEKQRHVEEYQRKNKEIESINAQIGELSRQKQGKGEDKGAGEKDEKIAELERKKQVQQKELRVYLAQLQKTHPDLAALLGAKPIELRAVQDQLPPEVAVLQYLVLPDKVTVFVIKNSGIEIVEIPVNKEDLEKKVKDFTAGIKSGKDLNIVARYASALYTILIKPVEDSGRLKGITTLGISPNGFMHYLPFGALISRDSEGNRQYLLEKYTLFYINSTSILGVAMDRAKQKTGSPSLLAFGNPDGTLKYAETEVNGIAELFSRKEVYNQKAARKEIISGTTHPHFSVLHLSTHGVLSSTDSRESYLVMSDGKLTVEDIWGLPLKGSDLTTLSACETGIGQILSGDDVVSLENAFIYAGSPSVVSTLWKVADESTAELMVLFYQNIQKGMTKSVALTDAQRQLRSNKEYSHPYFWAAFTLRGDWR